MKRPVWWGRVLATQNDETGATEYMTADRHGKIHVFDTVTSAREFLSKEAADTAKGGAK